MLTPPQLSMPDAKEHIFLKEIHMYRDGKLDGPAPINENTGKRLNTSSIRMDPIQYVAKVEHELTQFIHDNGDYLFMGFALLCFVAIGWLLSRKRKSLPPQPVSARTLAIVGIMLASPGMSSDADGGRTRLIMGDDPTRRTDAFNSGGSGST